MYDVEVRTILMPRWFHQAVVYLRDKEGVPYKHGLGQPAAATISSEKSESLVTTKQLNLVKRQPEGTSLLRYVSRGLLLSMPVMST